jgi:hypothetical protein
MKKTFAVCALLVSAPLANATAGCSSSDSAGDTRDASALPLPDSGGSQPDSAGTMHDSGGDAFDFGDSADATSTTPQDSGGPPLDSGEAIDADGGAMDAGTDAGDSGDDGSIACPPSPAMPFTPVAYVAATRGQDVCQASDIALFVTACGYNGTAASCQAWRTTYAGDAGTTCGNCIFAPMNNGGVWSDLQGFFEPNFAGCIQVTDVSASGVACATAINNVDDCDGNACDQCASGSDYIGCQTAAYETGGTCSSYETAVQTACASDDGDGGAIHDCFPGSMSGNSDDNYTYIIALICGNGIP